MKSELRDGVNTIIKYVGWLMIPTAVLLITAQIRADLGLIDAVQASVAGLVAMVPEGLVLLTSVAFAVSATRLARQKVLTQELAAIEGLARVDVICLDKTGTLTEGQLVLGTVEHVDDAHAAATSAALAAMAAADDHPNPSLLAIRDAYDQAPGWAVDRHRAVLVGPQVERRRLRRATAPGCSAPPTSCSPGPATGPRWPSPAIGCSTGPSAAAGSCCWPGPRAA